MSTMALSFENGSPSELKVITMLNHRLKWCMAVSIKVNNDIVHIVVGNKHDILSKYAQIINMLFSMYDDNGIVYSRMDVIKAVASTNAFVKKYESAIDKYVYRMDALPMPVRKKNTVRKFIKMPKQ